MNNAQKIQAGFDIGNLNAAAAPVTFDVPVIFDADGEAVASLTIVGKNSEQYRLASNAVRAEGYKKSARRKTAIDASTDAGAELLVQAIDGNQKRLALAVVTGWSLQDAVDLDMATEIDLALLRLWKLHRVAVNRIELTLAVPQRPHAPA